MSLFELKVEVPAVAAAGVNEVLLELGLESWSVFDDVIVQRAWLVGIFSARDDGDAQWSMLEPILAAQGIVPVMAPVGRVLLDADWRESYKAHFHAWRFGRLHWVPVWERGMYVCPPGEAVLWLDPGMAFGTGNHETTRLCVERLVALAQARGAVGRVVDAGCGSGILALSAVLLGYTEVRGFDNDAEAIHVSQENAVANGLEGRVNFQVGDLVSGLADEQADVLLANIQADVLMRFSGELVAAVRSGGVLVLSGILATENERVRAAFAQAAPGWTSEARVMGEWSDVLLQRPS